MSTHSLTGTSKAAESQPGIRGLVAFAGPAPRTPDVKTMFSAIEVKEEVDA